MEHYVHKKKSIQKVLLIIFSLLLIFSGCKKEKENIPDLSQETLKMQKIAKEFNLQQSSPKPGKKTLNFSTVADLENYLRSKGTNKSSMLRSESAGSGSYSGLAEFEANSEDYSNASPYSIIVRIQSNLWDDRSFPNYATIQYDSSGNMNSSLNYSGVNFGEWNYEHLGGNGSYYNKAIAFNIYGTYTEIYSVGGVFSYSRNWDVRISGQPSPGRYTFVKWTYAPF